MSASPTVIVKNRSQDELANPDLLITRQMDELWRLSEEERDRQIGSTWLKEVYDFYTLTGGTSSSAPSFRPRVIIPELQMLVLSEATDISESFPKVFVLNKGKREKERERAFQEHWRQQQYSVQQLLAEIWALFAGTGFLQIGLDPEGRRGRGEVWMNSRDPATCCVDPGTIDNQHWVYHGFEDRMYIDEICRLWPETGRRLRRNMKGYRSLRIGYGADEAGSGPGGLQLPEGPMRYGSGGVPQKRVPGDGLLTVRQLFINDYATTPLSEQERKLISDRLGPLVAAPQYKLKYPHGRWLVESEGVVLADGDSWIPLRRNCLIPVQAMPRLRSFWVPPPVRYSKSLQELAERMFRSIRECHSPQQWHMVRRRTHRHRPQRLRRSARRNPHHQRGQPSSHGKLRQRDARPLHPASRTALAKATRHPRIHSRPRRATRSR